MSWFSRLSTIISISRSGFSRDRRFVVGKSRLKPLLPCWIPALRNLFLSSLSFLLLSGCGFHLRGVVDLPPDVSTIHIQTKDRYSPFYRELVAMIRTNGVELSAGPASADAVIEILSDESARRPLTVSARNVPREYEVYYVVVCSVSVHDETIVESQRFILTRDYTYDETKVLGKANEEAVLIEALAGDLVGLLVQTISAAR